MNYGMSARIFAAVIAAAAWTGLLVQLFDSYSASGSLWGSLWAMLGYFTILTNILVGVVFTCIALGWGEFAADWVVAGTMLSIVLVGVVVVLLLRGAMELSGGSVLVDKLLHEVTPVLVTVFWIFLVRKGELKWRHPGVWAIFPLAYLVYGSARGLATGKYAYPFLNIAVLGWGQTALNAFLIAVGFMACGYGVVWVDQLVGSADEKRAYPRG